MGMLDMRLKIIILVFSFSLSSILIYAQTDSSSILINRSKLDSSQVSEKSVSSFSDFRVEVGLFAGIAFPVGKLAENAKTGFSIGAQLYTNGRIGGLISFSYSRNPSKVSGSWELVNLLIGLKLRIKEDDKWCIFLGLPCLGGNYTKNPTPTHGFMPSSSTTGLAFGGLLHIEQANWTIQFRTVAGMVGGYEPPPGWSPGHYSNVTNMGIAIAVMDLSVGVIL
jgi:hypothetical protein